MNDALPICHTPGGFPGRLLAWVLLCGLLLSGSGCSVAPKRPETAMGVHPTSDIAANTEQIRVRMRALVQPMSSTIAAAADQILVGTDDPAIRREALLWKIEAVPAVREALFRPNPMIAIGDAWVLTFQMIDYFEKGPGAKALGEAHTIAVTTSQQLEAEFAQAAASLTISGDVSHVRDYARKWAAAHPIQHSIAGRESLLSQAMDVELATSFSAQQAAGNLLVSVDDLSWRLEVHSAQLPNEARWQAELFAMDFAREHQVEVNASLAKSAVESAGHMAESLDRAVPALERSLDVVEKAPAMVAAEREATMKDVAGELTRTMTFIQEQRVVTVEQLTKERIAAVQELDKTAVRERTLLAQDLNQTALKTIDFAFIRATQLTAVVLLALFLGIILLILFARRVFLSPRISAGHRPSENASGNPAKG